MSDVVVTVPKRRDVEVPFPGGPAAAGGSVIWQRTWRADPRAAALADRHYSRKTVGADQFAPPGPVLVLITADGRACWVTWRTEYPDAEWLRDAWCCTLFRNEAPELYLSSDLVTEAVAATVAAWGDPPPGGTVTTIDAGKVRAKRDPGRCFLRAGFVNTTIRTIDRGLIVLRLAPAAHPAPVRGDAHAAGVRDGSVTDQLDTGAPPPCNVPAEESVLGAVLLAPRPGTYRVGRPEPRRLCLARPPAACAAAAAGDRC